jgi:hypothetical protein
MFYLAAFLQELASTVFVQNIFVTASAQEGFIIAALALMAFVLSAFAPILFKRLSF